MNLGSWSCWISILINPSLICLVLINKIYFMNSDKFSVKSRFGSFKFAFTGLSSLLKIEHNARTHLLIALIVIILGIVMNISLTEWCLIIIVIGLVFLAELFNTALETLSDI